MVKILPPYIDRDCKSGGEKLLFDIFKTSSFTKNWTILHSLNLSQHTRRLYGEIDFLILIPNGGIFIMEVKSGDVKCVNGVWHYTNRFGSRNTSNVGPFNQARDAMYSLMNAIQFNFGKNHRFSKILAGFFCTFPHINFDKKSVEYEPWQILDRDLIKNNIEGFFQRLIQNFIQKYKGQRWFNETESLPSSSDIDKLCDFLRGDFERIHTLCQRLEDFNNQVNIYTEEQYRILDSIQMNERSVIQGCAGAGKTMIAIESAVRAASEGKTVFLTCYNRIVGEWMQEKLKPWKEKIIVSSLHSYMFNLLKGFDYDKSSIDSQDFYVKYLPNLLQDFFNKGIKSKFDKLIIDEGQDLIREDYLRLFDAMLKNGLKNGDWEIYGDFERQAIYAQLQKYEMFKLLGIYGQYSNFLLKINCRNTKQIGEEVSLISGFEKSPFLLEYLEGFPVEYIFYNGIADQISKLDNSLIKLKSGKLLLDKLIILSPKKFENSCVSSISSFKVQKLQNYTSKLQQQDAVTFTTIQAYKGMESDYVFIVDIEDLTSEFIKSILYIGMSRARYGLTLFIAESKRNEYLEILKNKLL